MKTPSSADLESTLRQVESSVCLIPVRHLRRLLRHMQDQGHLIPLNADLAWWIDRSAIPGFGYLPDKLRNHPSEHLLVLSDANDRLVEGKSRGFQLRVYWRLIFQGWVLREIEKESLSLEECRKRLDRLGMPVVREVRHVLELDHRLHPEADEAALYKAFVVAYLEWQAFQPQALSDIFPSLTPDSSLREVLPATLDAQRLYQESRPAGADDHDPEGSTATLGDEGDAEPEGDPAEAKRAIRSGNYVRAAIVYARLPGRSGQAREQIRRLVHRLAEVCGWSEPRRAEWASALSDLLVSASRGVWSRAARCLYELQKIPSDLRGEIYSADLVEWFRTLGRRPIRRPLPRTRPVLLLQHLKAAEKQLLRSDATAAQADQLHTLLRQAIEETETEIRREFAPVIVRVLEESGLRVENPVEVVARDKLVAELLDRICERGYLRIGNLRDAIARNQLKMRDLSGIREFWNGDPFLQADVRLAYELDGIHRRGEFYLRWLQRFSSLFFGTPWGRWLTLYLILPFGGSFLVLMFAEEVRHLSGQAVSYLSTLLAPKPLTSEVPPATIPDIPRFRPPDTDAEWEQAEWNELLQDFVVRDTRQTAAELATDLLSSTARFDRPTHASFLTEAETILGFGLFLLLVMHVARFRRWVIYALTLLGDGLFTLCYRWPLALWRSSWLKWLRNSVIVQFIFYYLGLPLLLTGGFIGLLRLLGAPWSLISPWGVFFFGLAAVVVNTRLGWLIQDRILEELSDAWRIIRINLIPGLIATILSWFKALANWGERRLYDVDEALRFRAGDSHRSFVLKALGGLIWFPIAYTTRFMFYLLVEPQINPVKHFPVVTVGHKVIWPMVPQLANWTGLSIWTVSMIVNGIPGIFGFIVWELKENWRLYRANRPATLRPVIIGSHGETMRGLLRPGFHSGRLPKIYRRLRQAWQKGRSDLVSREHHNREHVVDEVRLFVERELIALLAEQPEWQGQRLAVAGIDTGCRRARVTILAGLSTVQIEWESYDGFIEARILDNEVISALNPNERDSLRDAIKGLFNLAAASNIPPWPWSDWVSRWSRHVPTSQLIEGQISSSRAAS